MDERNRDITWTFEDNDKRWLFADRIKPAAVGENVMRLIFRQADDSSDVLGEEIGDERVMDVVHDGDNIATPDGTLVDIIGLAEDDEGSISRGNNYKIVVGGGAIAFTALVTAILYKNRHDE